MAKSSAPAVEGQSATRTGLRSGRWIRPPWWLARPPSRSPDRRGEHGLEVDGASSDAGQAEPIGEALGLLKVGPGGGHLSNGSRGPTNHSCADSNALGSSSCSAAASASCWTPTPCFREAVAQSRVAKAVAMTALRVGPSPVARAIAGASDASLLRRSSSNPQCSSVAIRDKIRRALATDRRARWPGLPRRGRCLRVDEPDLVGREVGSQAEGGSSEALWVVERPGQFGGGEHGHRRLGSPRCGAPWPGRAVDRTASRAQVGRTARADPGRGDSGPRPRRPARWSPWSPARRASSTAFWDHRQVPPRRSGRRWHRGGYRRRSPLAGLDGLADAPVHAYPAVGGDLLVQRRADEGMGEPVTAHRAPASRSTPAWVASSMASRSSSPEGPPAASTVARANSVPITAAQLQHVVGHLRQGGQAAAHHLADPLGDAEINERDIAGPPVVAPHDQPGLGQVPQHLADEEGVALGLGVHRLRQLQSLARPDRVRRRAP